MFQAGSEEGFEILSGKNSKRFLSNWGHIFWVDFHTVHLQGNSIPFPAWKTHNKST